MERLVETADKNVQNRTALLAELDSLESLHGLCRKSGERHRHLMRRQVPSCPTC